MTMNANMNSNNETSEAQYGISRIDDDRYHTHAWRVSLTRRGKRHVRNFSDKKCGDKETALSLAVEFRDRLLLRYPPISRKEFCDAKRRNNKTGITGVYRYSKSYRLKDGTVKESWYWEANWPSIAGTSICKSYSVKRYGEELAKQMAIRARIDGLQGVEGTFWASERGAVPAPARVAGGGIFSKIREFVSEVA
ncbi:MAG: AP2 domain-containing protein [Gammaproteobacteria bacterium]|nr:AP2 domain-containing protein [Gammaproteobacteria bacterium]